MKSDPRGLAVIINNEVFPKMSMRRGTDCDLEMLQNLFEQLRFTVETFCDLIANVSGNSTDLAVL